MIRSDALATWHAFLADFPAFAAALGMPNQLRLVVDANVVLGDLCWLVVKRRAPAARTTLDEVIAAGTVVVYVPPVLHRDVEKGLRDLSAEEGIPLEQLTAACGRRHDSGDVGEHRGRIRSRHQAAWSLVDPGVLGPPRPPVLGRRLEAATRRPIADVYWSRPRSMLLR